MCLRPHALTPGGTTTMAHAAAPVMVIPPVDIQGIDGAVAELTLHGDGFVTAEIRIPGPAAP